MIWKFLFNFVASKKVTMHNTRGLSFSFIRFLSRWISHEAPSEISNQVKRLKRVEREVFYHVLANGSSVYKNCWNF